MNAANQTRALALVFPGQGSQSIGMLAELSELHPSIKTTFEEASDGAGVDLWALSQAGPEAVSYTHLDVYKRQGHCTEDQDCRRRVIFGPLTLWLPLG